MKKWIKYGYLCTLYSTFTKKVEGTFVVNEADIKAHSSYLWISYANKTVTAKNERKANTHTRNQSYFFS